MNNFNKILPLSRLCARQISKTTAKSAAESVEEVPYKQFSKFKEIQKKFGVEDDIPVYLKAGFGDRILYLGTLILVGVSTALSGEVLYKLSVK